MTNLRTQAQLFEATMPKPFQGVDPREGERPFATIESYWRDPAPFEAEEAAMRAKAHAAIDAAIQRNREARNARS